ncbi:MAG: EF-hand domain-containing protein [Gammaproteobacteria bacterium]|nr:EF-hand domain-containing protein [Gammaproteobacteria bacterium]MDH3467708.1 EF-hand domain-containing protein [Gammaproteobacteria bacterium]
MKDLAPLVAGLSLSFLASTAFAQEMPEFVDLDVDKDGQITAEEAMAHEALREAFAIVDVDSSGAISQEEYEVFVKG